MRENETKKDFDEIAVIDEMDAVIDGNVAAPELEAKTVPPVYLREVIRDIKESDGRIYCTIQFVQLAKHTVADVFVAWLHGLMSRINDEVNERTGISILGNSAVRKEIVGAFRRLTFDMDVLFGRYAPDDNLTPLDRAADLYMTFSVRESVETIFNALNRHFGVSHEDIVLQVPKSMWRVKNDYQSHITRDGMAGEWTPAEISYGFMLTYMDFITVDWYTKVPKIPYKEIVND